MQRIEKLAIVGASTRAAAFSALRAGYEVVTADLFADADLTRLASTTKVSDYPLGFASWLASAECDAWLYTGALENHPELVGAMATCRPLCGNSVQLRNARDPLRLQSCVCDAGLSFPETQSDAELLPLDGSWLCKTYRGSSGSGVWALDGTATREHAARERAVFQRFVSGTPAAAIFVVAEDGARLLGVTRQILSDHAEHPWHYIGSIGPLVVDDTAATQLATLGDLLCRQLSMRGVVGVDLVIADGKLWVIEINPRYTASTEILERASGVSAIAAHVAACHPARARDSPDDVMKAGVELLATGVHGKAIVFAPRDAIISQAFHDWALGQSSLAFADDQLADIPHAVESIPARRPVLTAFASAPTVEDCEQRLSERLAEVTARLYDE